MKIKLLLFLFVLTCPALSPNVCAQARVKYMGLEVGADAMICKDFNKDYVRGYTPASASDGILVKNITSQMYKTYVGIKVERFSLNNKFGILSGIRFSQVNSTVKKNTSPDFFYFLNEENGTTTEYLRIREINQASTYAGIPVELRYFPLRPHKVSIFFKLGAEFNFLLKTKTDVTFLSGDLGIYKNEVVNKVGDPNSFYSTLYGGAGIRIGNSSKARFSIEARVPSVLITSNLSSLTNADFGGGVQVNVQIPF